MQVQLFWLRYQIHIFYTVQVEIIIMDREHLIDLEEI
ncbi:Uncharacterised protein [Mycobacterium tuberculosis]|nr:Uncharacterised protein [Mycobacterium tuberculosis]